MRGRPEPGQHVAYSARYIAATCQMGRLPSHERARGGFAIGELPHRRGVVIGYAPDWADLVYVRWGDDPAVAMSTHVANVVCVRDLAQDADAFQHASLDATPMPLPLAGRE